ncbi:hypothetical protein NDU88_004852 [Pleurodeles waltl]|uniref:Uncharacterized protein n=1 Tax=Pleurodeles waltl TaxID=8319 RepID=A0AAV7SK00_PLEWA|nr:hypothetical protein NDU88_004852 [Pleurodeles waltl]
MPGILGRRADRSRHLYSPDSEARTAGPGEPMSEPATLPEKRGQARYGVLTRGKGAGGGRRKGNTGTNTKSTDGWGTQGRKREETKGQDAGRSYEPKIGARREKERETDQGEERGKVLRNRQTPDSKDNKKEKKRKDRRREKTAQQKAENRQREERKQKEENSPPVTGKKGETRKTGKRKNQ